MTPCYQDLSDCAVQEDGESEAAVLHRELVSLLPACLYLLLVFCYKTFRKVGDLSDSTESEGSSAEWGGRRRKNPDRSEGLLLLHRYLVT